MKKLDVKGVQNIKCLTWWVLVVLICCFTISRQGLRQDTTVKKKTQKEVENGFMGQSNDTQWTLNGHVNYLRENKYFLYHNNSQEKI